MQVHVIRCRTLDIKTDELNQFFFSSTHLQIEMHQFSDMKERHAKLERRLIFTIIHSAHILLMEFANCFLSFFS